MIFSLIDDWDIVYIRHACIWKSLFWLLKCTHDLLMHSIQLIYVSSPFCDACKKITCKLCKWLIESVVVVYFFCSCCRRRSFVWVTKSWYNLSRVFLYSVFVAEYEYPRKVDVWRRVTETFCFGVYTLRTKTVVGFGLIGTNTIAGFNLICTKTIVSLWYAVRTEINCWHGVSGSAYNLMMRRLWI